jgi:hypothetical protein
MERAGEDSGSIGWWNTAGIDCVVTRRLFLSEYKASTQMVLLGYKSDWILKLASEINH